MGAVGIEALNVFAGSAYLDVKDLAVHRQLDPERFEKLLMKEKTVALPYEDPISFGVNAAKPLIDALDANEKDRIEMLITCSESGIDFGKSISNYIHEYLGLSRNCRLFELKQACYSTTAGLQMAVNFILSGTSPGAKALVIGTDISRFISADAGEALTADWSFAEPSSGSGSVAMLVSARPHIFQIDQGAFGIYGFEVMDTCRPYPDGDAGDSDLSLLSYLDCCENAYGDYKTRVPDAHYQDSFQYLGFHTPFGGMVKGAHRSMMRKETGAKPEAIEVDFETRVIPGLSYCQRVGNIMGGTLYLALAGMIDHGDYEKNARVGCFSYGSGCCSEFYSGVITDEARQRQQERQLKKQLDSRYKLSMDEYDALLSGNAAVRFGTRNVVLDRGLISQAWSSVQNTNRLFLKEIREFHREYEWV
ncbi:MAG: hydroxymethylglutaryl-CoA synthase family protein [Candidatus Lindowbacteria bacterium]|nr:hydroxymethylglutaryl-CoA synthase family protein [Candidatus Lindowbacteria bacterium]